MIEVRQTLSAKDRLILALDTSTFEQALKFVDQLSEYVGVFKIGLELFVNTGLSLMEELHQRGLKVFFDGNFLDIPDAVARESHQLALKGVDMFTLDASGGRAMLEASVQACQSTARQMGKNPPASLGMTVLTSLNQDALQNELHVVSTMADQVLRLGQLCQACGLSGVVTSAQELPQLRSVLGSGMLYVTPGVRPVWAEANDHTRVVTPAEAIANGSDYLVIGRPITRAKDPCDAAKRILFEMDSELSQTRAGSF